MQEYGTRSAGDSTHRLIHPELLLDFRPVVGWSQYKTPIENLYAVQPATPATE